jgi:hypothetical protein
MQKTCEVFSISEELKLDAVSVLSVQVSHFSFLLLSTTLIFYFHHQPSPDNLLDEIPVPVIPLLDIPNHSLAFPRFMSPFFNDGPVERLSSTDTTATINPDSDTSFVQQRLEKELKSSVGWKRIVPPEVVMPAPVVDIDLVIEVVEPEEDVQTDFQIRNFPKPLQPNDERITWLHDMVRTAIDCHILNPGGALAAFAQIHSDIDAMRISTPANSIGASKTLNALWMISRACESLGRRVPDAPTAELLTWDLYVEFSKIRKALKDFGISRERPSGTVEEIAGLEIGGIPAWYRFQEMARGLEKLIGSVRGFADWLGWQKPDIKAPMKDLIREQQRIERILRGDPEDVEQEIGLTPWQPTRWQMLVFRLKLSIRKLKEKRAAKAAAKAAARAKKNKRL